MKTHNKFYYISPSTLPSRNANSVHVVMQCHALAQLGADVTLFARTDIKSKSDLFNELEETYGINFAKSGITLVCYSSRYQKAGNVLIACLAIRHLFVENFVKKRRGGCILSRNLYAAFILGVVLKKPLFFETHQLEMGFRKKLQKLLISAKWITTITISQKLMENLYKHHGCPVQKSLVLHDAAPADIQPCCNKKEEYRFLFEDILDEKSDEWNTVCGYLGHLYQGRGIEIIEQMAVERPNVLFIIVGGNPDDVIEKKANQKSINIRYLGHVSHPIAQKIMKCVDVLLMPYQESVSLKTSGHDTAKWMSPMKMFEYMASGVPIISSDLPVLSEILRRGENALLVPPADVNSWLFALDKLISDSVFARTIGENAHLAYKTKHTWTRRAQCIIDKIKEL